MDLAQVADMGVDLACLFTAGGELAHLGQPSCCIPVVLGFCLDEFLLDEVSVDWDDGKGSTFS